MAPNPSSRKPRPASEHVTVLRYKAYEETGQTIRAALKYGAILGVAFLFYRSMAVLAGQVTFADIAVRLAATISVSRGVAYLFGTGGIVYGVAQRRLRQRAVTRISDEKNALERLLDEMRSSSNLTKHGMTRPGDKG